MSGRIDPGRYLADPCRESSLPFWKTRTVTVPEGVKIVRDDEYCEDRYTGRDERYFRMKHDFAGIPDVSLPEGFEVTKAGTEELAEHINSCYEKEHVTAEELEAYRDHPVYDPKLWIAVKDEKTGSIAASGIAELDRSIGEGVLEWIQVSPGYRRQGLGSFIVCELLRRLRGKADFVTVSGRMDSGSSPRELYGSCGFTGEVIWHVIT